MSKPETQDVLEAIVEIARSIKYRGEMLNERYLHHYFSHLLQDKYNLLNLVEGNPIGLHPEWPTYKKTTQIFYARYKKEQGIYIPSEDGKGGWIDFAIGDYEKPDIGIEFKLGYGWTHENVVFDFLKMLDQRLPFSAAFSFNVIFRPDRLTTGNRLMNLENHLNDAYKEAVNRLKSKMVDDSREIYFMVSEIAKNNRRHWHYDKTMNRFKRTLPILN